MIKESLMICRNHGQLELEQIQLRKCRTKFSTKITQSCKICHKISKKKRIPIDENILHRTCSKCDLIKNKNDYSDFEWYRPSPWCVLCKRILQNNHNVSKANKGQTKQHKRRYRLKSCFGISEQDYELLFIKQKGLCAICKQPETMKIRGILCHLAIDHCHEFEKQGIMRIRGLLCKSCNNGLGHFKDNAYILQTAIEYLNT